LELKFSKVLQLKSILSKFTVFVNKSSANDFNLFLLRLSYLSFSSPSKSSFDISFNLQSSIVNKSLFGKLPLRFLGIN
jgi:hypothetical protein